MNLLKTVPSKTQSVSLALLLATSFIPSAHAYEVDNFTRRLEPLPDARARLNAETQRQIDAAIAEENAQHSCTIPEASGRTPLPSLLVRIKNRLDTNPVATIENWAVEDLNPDYRHEVSSRRSIYSEVSVADGPVLRMAGVEPSIRVGTHYIGADKLGHFMAQGYEYFEVLWRSGSVQQALSYGRGLEDGYYGITSTGVRSFGDLAANFSGMNFYHDILFGPNPLIRCEGGRFRRVREFDWGNYANDAWDEGTNCSEFNAGVTRSVQQALRSRGMSCPVDLTRCQSLATLPCASRFVSPACQRHWPAVSTGVACPTNLPGLPTRIAAVSPSRTTPESCAGHEFEGDRERLARQMIAPQATSLFESWEQLNERMESATSTEALSPPSTPSENRTT